MGFYYNDFLNDNYKRKILNSCYNLILFIYLICFHNGDTYIVKMYPLLKTRIEVQYWGPMVTENTFAVLHIYNTCIVLKLFWLPITAHTALFFIGNVSMLSPSFVSGHSFSDRTEMVVLLAKQILSCWNF